MNVERAGRSAWRILSTGALLVVIGGCGGSPPAEAGARAEPEPRVTTGGEGLGVPRPEPIAREVRAYRAPEETATMWLDLEALRGMEGWSSLHGQLRELLLDGTELSPLVADPTADPLEHASLLVLSEGAGQMNRVITLELADPAEARGLVDGVAATGWVPVAGAEMAGLSTADDAPTIAIDRDNRVVVASPGTMRGALRAGPREVEAFWEPGTVLALEARFLDTSQRPLRAWASRSNGEVRVAVRRSAADASAAEEAAAGLAERRDSLLGSPVARVMGLEEALAKARIRAAGSDVHAETSVSEAEAMRLLAAGVDAAAAFVERQQDLGEQGQR